MIKSLLQLAKEERQRQVLKFAFSSNLNIRQELETITGVARNKLCIQFAYMILSSSNHSHVWDLEQK